MITATRPGRGPSAHKRLAILDAARQAFLAGGYAGTTIDDVAASAGVSKQTVYAHFSDKARLFHELIQSDIATSDGASHPLVATMADTDDVEWDLAPSPAPMSPTSSSRTCCDFGGC